MSKITRGTTPYHRFSLPVSPDIIDKIYITYMQGDIKVEKSKEDIEFISSDSIPPVYKAVVHLTQQDTLKFLSKSPSTDPIEIQMDIKTLTGERYINDPPLRAVVGKVLKDEEI